MAKLFFNKSMGTPTRETLCGILSDSESTTNESKYTVIDISTSDFNNFVSYTKDFTVGDNNVLTWSDTTETTDENGNAVTQDKALYEYEIGYIKEIVQANKNESWNVDKLSKINTFVTELDAIDTTSITFPITGNIHKDIYSRCANSVHFMNTTVS